MKNSSVNSVQCVLDLTAILKIDNIFGNLYHFVFNIFALADIFWGCRFFARFYNHICVEKQWGTISENGVMIVWLWRKNNAKLVSLSEYFKCINVLLFFFTNEWKNHVNIYMLIECMYLCVLNVPISPIIAIINSMDSFQCGRNT